MRSKIRARAPWILGALIALSIPLYSVIARADLNYGSVHLLMGIPGAATASLDNPTDYLLIKPQYALSYNRDRNLANWASWQLNKSWLGNADRQNDFRPDVTLPKEWYTVRPSDYVGSGFDRGHLSPSEDRGNSINDNSATFLMTNMVPQAPDNNRVVWAKFEDYCRELVRNGKELYIVAGASGNGGIGEKGPMTLLKTKVTVPATMWKVVLVLDRPGMSPSQVTEKVSHTIAIVIPNEQGVKSKPWKAYQISVDDVEKLTGYDFFENIPQSAQKIIEATVDEAEDRKS